MYSCPKINIPSTFRVTGEEIEPLDELEEFTLTVALRGSDAVFSQFFASSSLSFFPS